MPLDKPLEAQAEFGMFPEASVIDDSVIEAALPIIAGMKQEEIKDTIEALRPVVQDAVARRHHNERLSTARHKKQGKYGFPRSTIMAIRDDIKRRPIPNGSSIWKEAITIMLIRRDEFLFEYDDGRNSNASVAIHGTKDAAACKGIACILIEPDGKEHEVKMSTIGLYLKKS